MKKRRRSTSKGGITKSLLLTSLGGKEGKKIPSSEGREGVMPGVVIMRRG